jgi:CRP/FNR family nitrogen fixation transcriptional regulator
MVEEDPMQSMFVAPASPRAAAFLPARPWTAAEARPLARARSFTKGDTILAAGERPAFLFEVVSGVVRTCQVLVDGRRKIAAFYMAGDVFGLDGAHRFAAEAVGDVTVLAFRRCESLSSLASGEGGVARMAMQAMMRDLDRAQNHMLVLARKTAVGRVAAFLLELSERLADTVIDLSMSRTDIADHLGLTIETVSRSMTQLEREGVIEVQAARRTVVLRDVPALHRFDE